MRYRQIHLDFHTSGKIPGIGSRFDPKDFAQTYKNAHVNAVNLFSKCHHGYSYHPTEIGEMHPHLEFDLLRAQVDALQAEGIKTPIYVSAVWDELAAAKHPEWRIVSPDGEQPMFYGEEAGGGWKFLDLSSPYVDYLISQIEEVVHLFPNLDGLWIDICFQLQSISPSALAGMASTGLDFQSEADRILFAEQTALAFYGRVRAIADKAGVPVFFNLGHLRRGRTDVLRRYFSHLEIESLPTGNWGYEHFPVSARYMEPLGMEYLGMTGKFHHMWGEMGGYKKPEALVYECGAMLAQGARICIGDHLHPSGRIDPSTYKAIGEAYKWVEDREPWCEGTANRAEIGVISTESIDKPAYGDRPEHHNAADDGVVRILLESKFTFDLLDEDSDYAPYRLLVLPDRVRIDAALKDKLDAYLAQGGRLLLTGASGIDGDTMLYPAGTEWHGTSPNKGGDFGLPVQDLRSSFVDEPLFYYAPAERLTLTSGKSLGDVYEPYFDRGENFSGHLNTPCQPDPSAYVFGARDGAVTRLAFPVFSAYYHAGAVAMLEIATRAIESALGRERMIRSDLPTGARATLRALPDGKGDVLHLVYATPVLRGVLREDNVQPIQDIVPLKDISVDLEARNVTSVRLVPEGTALEFDATGDRLRFRVPFIRAHQMVEVC
ncbi:beta-galactosidase-like protein [Aliiruegeria haliotis]|uniref:Beta-galactosidase-like protein n=1 Tax=Aliiruegeria haliotis TaxID=1280846 RepID=A0A2T0RLV8_9RHOB|nr:alpha-amylase family protein [Aliiruegeria haliotis]PRY22174.1 beta-galactosidase-like protein [Aliiruegeria haliotis]